MYTLPDGYLATTGQVILASQHNPSLEDLASSMTQSLPRNGTAGMLANLPMGGFKATNMADGVAASDSATVGQVTALISTSTAGAPTKSTPVDADSLMLIDSAASNALKRLTWANVKVALGLIYQPLNVVLTALAGIGTAVAGDVIYATGAGAWGRLAKGSALQQLRMNAGATAPEWFTDSSPQILANLAFTMSGSTITIVKNFNIASVVRNSSGVFTITFTNALPDANYAIFGLSRLQSSIESWALSPVTGTRATGSVQISNRQVGGIGPNDVDYLSFMAVG